jgi:transcriptional regulator with XRE-family HTH domain
MARARTKAPTPEEVSPEPRRRTVDQFVSERAATIGYAALDARRYKRMSVEEAALRSGLSPDFIRAFEAGTAIAEALEPMVRLAATFGVAADVRFHHGAGSPCLESDDAKRFLTQAISAAKAKGVPKMDYARFVRLLQFDGQPLKLSDVQKYCAEWEFEFDVQKYEAEEAERRRRCGWDESTN